jgi:hypothetical protein
VTSLEAKAQLDLVSASINDLSQEIAQPSGDIISPDRVGWAQAVMARVALLNATPILSQVYTLATVITNVLQSVEVLSYTGGSSRGRWSYSWAGNEDIKMQDRLDSAFF